MDLFSARDAQPTVYNRYTPFRYFRAVVNSLGMLRATTRSFHKFVHPMGVTCARSGRVRVRVQFSRIRIRIKVRVLLRVMVNLRAVARS